MASERHRQDLEDEIKELETRLKQVNALLGKQNEVSTPSQTVRDEYNGP